MIKHVTIYHFLTTKKEGNPMLFTLGHPLSYDQSTLTSEAITIPITEVMIKANTIAYIYQPPIPDCINDILLF